LLKSIEDITSTKKRLKIEIPSDILEREIKDSLEKIRQRARIPGFRTGKAPISLIEKRFGKDVEAEVLDKVIPEHLDIAIREADIRPVTMPLLEDEFKFERNTPLSLSITIEIMPKVENLNYENLTVKDLPVDVEESEIDNTLINLQHQKALYEVAEKDIEKDDLATFEYVDSEIIGATDPSLKEVIEKMGNEIFPPGIIEKAIGKKKGDIIEFTTTFDETKSDKLAGKTAQVKVKVSEVKKKILPALDDEFAKDIGFESLSQLREKLKEKIHEAKKSQAQRIQKAQIIEKLVATHPLDVPETLLNKEIESLMLEKNLDNPKDDEVADSDSVSDLLESTLEEGDAEKKKDNAEDIQEELKQKAVRNIQASILVEMIGQKESVFVTDNEVEERIALLAKKLSATPEAVKNFYLYKQGSLDGLKHSIYEEKVMDLLLSKATIEKGE
jgi:trigger factor